MSNAAAATAGLGVSPDQGARGRPSHRHRHSARPRASRGEARVDPSLAEWLCQFDDLKAPPPAAWVRVRRPDAYRHGAETRLAAKLGGVTSHAEKVGQEVAAAETAEALWTVLARAATLLGLARQDLFITVRNQTAHFRYVWDGKRISTLYAFDKKGTPIEAAALASHLDVLEAA